MIRKQINTRTKYFISYMAIFLITLVFFYATFRVATEILRKNIFEQNQNAIKQSQQLITNELETVMHLLQLIANDNDIKLSVQKQNPIQLNYIDNALSMVSLQSRLSIYTAVDSFVDHIAIYNTKEDFCVTSSAIYLRLAESLTLNFPDSTFISDVLSVAIPNLEKMDTVSLISDKSQKNQYLLFSQPLSPLINDEYVMIFINTKNLIPYFSSDPSRGNFYIFDKLGLPLFSSEAFEFAGAHPTDIESVGDIRVNDEEYTIAQTKSELSGFTYISVLPSKQVMEDMAFTQRCGFLFLTLSFLLVFGASTMLTNLNYRPIRKLMKSMNLGTSKFLLTNEFSLIQEHISYVEQRSQEHMSRSLFMEFLNGNFHDREDLQSLFLSFPISEQSPEIAQRYIILLAELDFPNSFDTIKNLNSYHHLQQYLATCATKNLPDTVMVVETNHNHSVLLLNLKHMTLEEVANSTLSLSHNLFTEENVHIRFSMSNIVAHLTDLPMAYSNAILAMDHASDVEGSSLIRYSDEKNIGTGHVYFPPSLQLKLTNLVTSSDVDGVHELLKNLCLKNIPDVYSSEVSLRLLYFNLCTCIVDLTNRLAEIPAELSSSINQCLNAKGNYPKNLALLNNCFLTLAPLFSMQKEVVQDSINQDILLFVNENLFSHELCLPMLSNQFQLSEPYISALIKDLTGMTFINYTTTHRIDEALRLLRKSTLSINEIADKIGYNSTNSFRKAFKKATGQSPSSYQRSI